MAPIEEPDAGREEIEIEAEQEEEEEPAERAPDPKMPSPDEVERHRVDHFPYRCWCRWCVMGRGVGRPHAMIGGKSEIPSRNRLLLYN